MEAALRIIGLLSWYDEPAGQLAECVAAAARLCDHILAVDGPYAEFPGALRRPASSSEQADVIARTAAGSGIGATIHIPRTPWWDGEVGKRDWMFRAAEILTQPGDWLLVIDADEIITDAPTGIRNRLAASTCDVAELMLWDRTGTATPDRRLIRAQPGLHVEGAHYVWTAPTPDGGKAILRGNATHHDLADAEQLLEIRVEHRTLQRDPHRQDLKRDYYARVPELEHLP